ncbi:hypothetical protein I4641_08595 [Waterburya agarophytonicola K14]|uniref:Uncharacterized protein n=1 Tax=Waterburya agarophytonicola KI4 TaxID=2874699 RepID=A0A964BP68_9CYAN|nr:hypothetical protein [Waterburya agarophytonicola]MCC0177033.1 hypothetical protein [Waterburya agarophytonicola KI4]
MNTQENACPYYLSASAYQVVASLSLEAGVTQGQALEFIVQDWQNYREVEEEERNANPSPLDVLVGKIDEVDSLVDEVIRKLKVASL